MHTCRPAPTISVQCHRYAASLGSSSSGVSTSSLTTDGVGLLQASRVEELTELLDKCKQENAALEAQLQLARAEVRVQRAPYCMLRWTRCCGVSTSSWSKHAVVESARRRGVSLSSLSQRLANFDSTTALAHSRRMAGARPAHPPRMSVRAYFAARTFVLHPRRTPGALPAHSRRTPGLCSSHSRCPPGALPVHSQWRFSALWRPARAHYT